MIAITNTIPDILKQLVQWVCWILMPDPKGGKPKKVPINPRTGKAAKPNDPSTWTDYQTAVSAAEKYGYSGIGFMLAEDDGFVVVDIDHCYDPQTKSFNGVAKAIMGRQDTYAELSPSGDGVHLWYLGAKPGKASKNTETGVEMYDCGRYLTVTGDILPGATPDIQQVEPDTLTWIHATYVAKSGAKKKKAKRKYRREYAIQGEVLPFTQFKRQLEKSEFFIEKSVQHKFIGVNERYWRIDFAKLSACCDVTGFLTAKEAAGVNATAPAEENEKAAVPVSAKIETAKDSTTQTTLFADGDQSNQ